jgi:plasmid stabilization system protein ParE
VTLAIDFRPEAELEVEAAYGWYEEQWPGLGSQFLLALGAAVIRAAENPLLFPKVARRTHRAVLRRFPYVVFYVIEGRRLVITGVFHGHRDPRDWSDRVREDVALYGAAPSLAMAT